HAFAQGARGGLRRLRLQVFQRVQRRVEVTARVDAVGVQGAAQTQQLLFVAQGDRVVAVVELAVVFRLLQVDVIAQARGVAYRLTGMTHGEGMGAVVHHFQIAATGDFFDAFNGARVAEHVSADDGRGVRHDAAFDVLGRNVPAERRGHCAAAQAQGTIGDLKGEGTVVGEDDVLDAQVVLEALLQFTHQRAMVGQPTPGVDALDVSLELVDITQ
nr:hypothetical protein [Tanacetum cinerariifolium]